MFLTCFLFAHARLLMSADRLVEERLLKPSVALGFLFKTRWTGSSVFRLQTKMDFTYIIHALLGLSAKFDIGDMLLSSKYHGQ